jgi:hypothetical protein
MLPVDRRQVVTAFVSLGTALALLTSVAGLGLAAGRPGLVLGGVLAVVVLATPRPVGFALGQAAVAGAVSPATDTLAFAAVEAGLVYTLFVPHRRPPSSWYAVGLGVVFFLGFLGLLQVARLRFGSSLGGVLLVAALGVVVFALVYRAETGSVAAITEGRR